jgi:hypothetical protein
VLDVAVLTIVEHVPVDTLQWPKAQGCMGFSLGQGQVLQERQTPGRVRQAQLQLFVQSV